MRMGEDNQGDPRRFNAERCHASDESARLIGCTVVDQHAHIAYEGLTVVDAERDSMVFLDVHRSAKPGKNLNNIARSLAVPTNTSRQSFSTA